MLRTGDQVVRNHYPYLLSPHRLFRAGRRTTRPPFVARVVAGRIVLYLVPGRAATSCFLSFCGKSFDEFVITQESMGHV